MPERTGALVNPLAAINQEAYDEEHHSAINLGIAALTARSATLRSELDAAVNEAGDDFDVAKVTTLKGDTPQATLGNIVDHHSRLTAANDVLNQQRAIRAQVQRRADADGRSEDDPVYDHMYEGAPMADRRTFPGAMVRAALTESGLESFVEAAQGRVGFDIDIGSRPLAATLTTGAGFAPESIRSGRVATLGRAALSMIDIVPGGTITQAAHVYMREGKPVQGAAGAASDASAADARQENANLAESEFTWEQVTDTVRSIGHFLPVTMEQLDDVPGMESLIDGRMMFGTRQAANKQIIMGDGTAPNLKGFLDFGNMFNQSSVDLSDNNDDPKKGKAMMVAARRMQTQLLTNGAVMPSHMVMHPDSWEKMNLLETASAGFYFGEPRVMSAEVLWGTPVVMDQYGMRPFNAAGNVVLLAGDFTGYSEFLLRHGFRVEFGMNNGDFRGLRQSVRAYVRGVLSVYRLLAFATCSVVA